MELSGSSGRSIGLSGRSIGLVGGVWGYVVYKVSGRNTGIPCSYSRICGPYTI